jgi:predicted nucleotidyltransferase
VEEREQYSKVLYGHLIKTMSTVGVEREKIADACRRHGIVFAGLFGSEARREASEQSDVDLLVRFGERKSLLDLVRIEREIGEELGRAVDLITESAVNDHLRDRIYDEMEVLLEEIEG